jgi:hypothetical protein
LIAPPRDPNALIEHAVEIETFANFAPKNLLRRTGRSRDKSPLTIAVPPTARRFREAPPAAIVAVNNQKHVEEIAYQKPSRVAQPAGGDSMKRAAMDIVKTLGISAFVLAAVSMPAFAQKKYDKGVTDTEIKIGNIMPYSGPA